MRKDIRRNISVSGDNISMDFMNAYTVTPYTHATAKTLFAHKYVVDDRSYKLKVDHESAFIQLIKDRGGILLLYIP